LVNKSENFGAGELRIFLPVFFLDCSGVLEYDANAFFGCDSML